MKEGYAATHTPMWYVLEMAGQLTDYEIPVSGDLTQVGYHARLEAVRTHWRPSGPIRTVTDWSCRVYWGSHGCDFRRGHHGPHMCGCCGHDTLAECTEECSPGSPPYYGEITEFYGEDV